MVLIFNIRNRLNKIEITLRQRMKNNVTSVKINPPHHTLFNLILPRGLALIFSALLPKFLFYFRIHASLHFVCILVITLYTVCTIWAVWNPNILQRVLAKGFLWVIRETHTVFRTFDWNFLGFQLLVDYFWAWWESWFVANKLLVRAEIFRDEGPTVSLDLEVRLKGK